MAKFFSQKLTRKPKILTKVCQYPECGKEYRGIGASKYCEIHREEEFRKKMQKMNSDKRKLNKVSYKGHNIEHVHNDVTTPFKMTCLCGKEYVIILSADINEYPKYCPDHRTPYRVQRLHESLSLE